MRFAPRAGLVAATLAVAATSAGLAGCGSSPHPHPHPAAARATPLGSYPSFLPKDTLNQGTDDRLTGTVQRPALTSQGDVVKVKTATFSVLATVSGPQVPGEGLPFRASADTCTWTVTMSGATGPVPIKTADFTAIDEQGHVYRPAFVKGQPAPPASSSRASRSRSSCGRSRPPGKASCAGPRTAPTSWPSGTSSSRMTDMTGPARRMWTLFEPVHAVTYFAPEALEAFKAAGLRGFWRGYFAGRAAPLERPARRW